MPRLARLLYSKLKDPLVNSAKLNTAKPKTELIYGTPNTTASSVESSKMATGNGTTTSRSGTADGFTTSSRSEFAEAYPSLYKRQEYHLSQLKAGKPVHLAGKFDESVNYALYLFSVVGVIYCMYLFQEHIRNT